jgi:hypothetical protein
MAYIGREPQIGNFQVCDAISVVDAQAAYTMQVGSVDVSPESANHMLVSLNGILQAPTTSYTVAGSTITFASALETGDVIDFIQILGSVLDLGVPSDDTVSLAKLTATGTKDATTFLRGDNTFDVPPLGGITEADNWRITADATTNGYITANWERNDANDFAVLGSGMSESSGVWTFPSTGKWLIFAHGDHGINNNSSASFNIYTTIDNSTYTFRVSGACNSSFASSNNTTNCHYIMNVTDVSNDKVKFQTSGYSSGATLRGNTAQNETSVTFIKLA